ncbi:MAG: lamin tail domain-containing protein, partial [Bacteroidota bacterium]|nr:lamin tail domain-containing protein [Bacteroidota bacterium]
MKKLLIVLLLAIAGFNPLSAFRLPLHLFSSPSMIMDSTAQLIISEVSDPANTWQARFVELYNPGTDSIDFDQDTWYLSKQSNGGSTWGDILLTGVIHAGKAYVVAYSESSFITTFGFNPDLSSGSINGNGDDGYFLFWGGNHNTGTLVDAYGEIDVDGTGEPWEYLDSKATREYDAITPETVWDSLNWTVHGGAETWQMTPSSHRVAVTWNGTI